MEGSRNLGIQESGNPGIQGSVRGGVRGDGVKICLYRSVSKSFEIIQNGVCGCNPNHFFEPNSFLFQTRFIRLCRGTLYMALRTRIGVQGSRDPSPWGESAGRIHGDGFRGCLFDVFRNKSKSSKRVSAAAAPATFSNRIRFCRKLDF